jgi:hypothetical protein
MHKIWLAEVDANDNEVIRLESGRDRSAIAAELVASRERNPDLVVGLDFAFSLPAWFLESNRLSDGPSLWSLVRSEGERWLAECRDPFWGRPGRPRPDIPEHFRRTDSDVPSIGGIRPKSVFQINGAGAVGTGSIRGMPLLDQLRSGGFSVWPFDSPTLPLVIEIYPRALTGAVNKGDRDARSRYLDRYPGVDSAIRERAESSEDAFDALVSALVMAEHHAELTRLPIQRDELDKLEGRIWLPSRNERVPQPTGSRNSSKTRVAPVFGELFKRSEREPQWLKRVLNLASQGREGKWTHENLALQDSTWPDRERGLEPPVALLSWLIRNVNHREQDDGVKTKTTIEKRKKLADRDPVTIAEALSLLRSGESRERWYILEGRTYPDVFIETEDALIVIEGKRTESGLTSDTKWMTGRHQMIRHLDAAFEIAGRRSLYGLLVVEGGSAAPERVPDEWTTAADAMLRPDALDVSLPHRGNAERERIAQSFVGTTTWEAIRREFDLPQAVLLKAVPSSDHVQFR